jgi:phage gp46-like protein
MGTMSHFQLSALTASLNTHEGLKHAVLQSLLNWEKAHNNDPLEAGQDKQGWWASDMVSAVGCRDWTLARAKQTPDTLNRVKRYTEQALAWLVDDKKALYFDVQVHFEGERLIRIIDITLPNNSKQQVKI